MVKKLYKDWEKDKDYSWIDQHDTCNFHQLSSEHFKKEIKNLKMFIEECEQANRKSKHSSKFSNTGESSSSRYLYVKFVVEVAILFEDLDYSSTKGDIKPEKETVSKVHEKEIVSKVHEKEIVSKVYEKETISPKEDMELSMPHIQNEDYSKEGRKCSNERSRLVKKILLRAAQLLPSVGCEFERGDDCKKIFPLVVQNADLCIDNRLLTDNVCDIAIQPTGVFTAPSKDLLHGWDENKRNYVWKLVVGVYDPSNETDSPSTTENDQNIDIGPPWSSELIRRDNWMNSSEFKTKIRQKIQSSVPQSCHNNDCLDKIAGEHVLQLFAMARQRISMKELDRGEFGTTAPGLFIVDHYVYFSRLCVSYPTMEYLTTGKCLLLNLPQVLRKGSKNDRPKVTFGNFCLDLTVANHRKAFVIFLQEFVLS